MRRYGLENDDKKLLAKIEETINETVIHKHPFRMSMGRWPFVVFGASSKESSIIRVGLAEQTIIKKAPLYIATLGGDHVPDSEGVPVEELAGEDVPEDIIGMKIFRLNPIRPISISQKKKGSSTKAVIDELLETYTDEDVAIIETPNEAYWVLSVLKYLEETDKFSGDPLMERFYSMAGRSTLSQSQSLFKH